MEWCDLLCTCQLASQATLSSDSLTAVEVFLHFNGLAEKHVKCSPVLLSACVKLNSSGRTFQVIIKLINSDVESSKAGVCELWRADTTGYPLVG